MRIIKLALISAVIIFLLMTAFSLLLPSHVRISRAINIAAPMEQITPYIADVGNWQQWNYLLTDTSIHITSITTGHIKTNKLEIKILDIKKDSISSAWIQPDGKRFEGNFSFMPADSVTVVQWYFDFHLRWYPWEKIGSIVYDDRMGPPMEKSLTALKDFVENYPYLRK
jgi:hypothetical protein